MKEWFPEKKIVITEENSYTFGKVNISIIFALPSLSSPRSQQQLSPHHKEVVSVSVVKKEVFLCSEHLTIESKQIQDPRKGGAPAIDGVSQEDGKNGRGLAQELRHFVVLVPQDDMVDKTEHGQSARKNTEVEKRRFCLERH